MLTLPDDTQRSLDHVLSAVESYRNKYRAVFDLYDLPSYGPHDEVLPVDVLSLNAMDAWGRRGAASDKMEPIWLRRHEITALAIPISRAPLEELDESQVQNEAEKVGAALHTIEQSGIKWIKYTPNAKLFHRLRPNLCPIWDNQSVGRWYGDSRGWIPWVKRVYRHVRERETMRCLLAGREQLDRLGVRLSLLRIWDIVLWEMAGTANSNPTAKVVKAAPPRLGG